MRETNFYHITHQEFLNIIYVTVFV